MKSIMTLLLTHYCAGDKIGNKYVGHVVGWGGERRVQEFGGET
jgi:hypothetical protein